MSTPLAGLFVLEYGVWHPLLLLLPASLVTTKFHYSCPSHSATKNTMDLQDAYAIGRDDDFASLFGSEDGEADDGDDLFSLFTEEEAIHNTGPSSVPQTPDRGSNPFTPPDLSVNMPQPGAAAPTLTSFSLPHSHQQIVFALPSPPREETRISGCQDVSTSLSLPSLQQEQDNGYQLSAEELELGTLLEQEFLKELRVDQAQADLGSHHGAQECHEIVRLVWATIKQGRQALEAGRAEPRRVDGWNQDFEFLMPFICLGEFVS